MTKLASLVCVLVPTTAFAHPGHGGDAAPIAHVIGIGGLVTTVLLVGSYLWTQRRQRT